MFKKTLVLVLTLCLLSNVFLVACGNKEVKTDVVKDDPSANTTKKDDEGKVEREPVNLVFLGFKTGPELGSLPEIIEDYQKENPHVTIDYEGVGTSYEDVLHTRLASGEQVDVFMSWTKYTKLYVDSEYVIDLSDKPYVETFDASLRESSKYDGKNYGFPMEASGMGLYANKDLLQKVGVEFPTNWDEFLTACEALKGAGILPIVAFDNTGWSSGNLARITMLSENKGNLNLGKEVISGATKLSEVYLPYLQKVDTLVQNGYINDETSTGMDGNQARTEFTNGNAAFMFEGTWSLGLIKEANNDMDLMFGPLPLQDNGPAKAFVLPGIVMYANANSEYTDEALNFLEYLTRPEVNSKWVKSQSAYSTVKGAESVDRPEIKLFAEAVQSGNTVVEYKEFDNYKVINEIRSQVPLLLIRKSTPEEIGKELDVYLEKQLAISGD